MVYDTEYYYLPQYEYVSTNQHGDRYKKIQDKQIRVGVLTCKISDNDDLTRLVLLSDRLRIPVHYDFEDHTAYVKIMGVEAVRGK